MAADVRKSTLKVVVLGAGLAGVTSLWFLVQHDHNASVVDCQVKITLETSFTQDSQVTITYSTPWATQAHC